MPPTWGRDAGSVTEVEVIADNEAVAWARGEPLRVCGACESQTYYQLCPECVDDEGKPVVLHEGQLTNVVAALRAQRRPDEVKDVFAELERLNPYRAIADTAVQWDAETAATRAKAQREREIRAMITGATALGGAYG